MTEQERQAIKQSMSDGYFQKDGKHPRESEFNACIEFFESLSGINEEHIKSLFHCIMSRELLISGFDLDTKYPEFILNEIVKQ